MNDVWQSDKRRIQANIADRRDNRANNFDLKIFSIGQRVRIVEPGTGMAGRVVVIRAYRTLCPGICWPCFEDRGELWPLNPEWIVATGARPHHDVEQLALFGGRNQC